MVAFGEGDLGYIVLGPGRRVQLTWDDMLWAARMLIGEAPRGASGTEGAAILWAMAGRMAVAPRFTSYTDMILNYSQPINPKWREDGEFCRPGGRFHGRDECSPTRLERRSEIADRPWEEIGLSVRQMVVNWARAGVQNPAPKTTDFAVPRVASRNGGLSAQGFEITWDPQNRGPESRASGGNCFYSSRRSREWSPNRIKVVYGAQEASDSSVDSVATTVASTSTGDLATRTSGEARVEVPENNILERISAVTSDRTSPGTNQYGYFILEGGTNDPQAQDSLDAAQQSDLIEDRTERFYNQVVALKQTSNLEMSQIMPIIEITTTDENGIVNLNHLIFGRSTLEGYFGGDEFESNPERPIASIDNFQVNVNPTQYGATSLSEATLTIKVHNPEMVRGDHPRGRYIALLLQQGYNLRVKYGVFGSYDMSLTARTALQWKEEDFFISNYRVSMAADKTATITLNLMPNTQKLLNHIHIGESIPASDITRLSPSDINSIVDSVTAGDSDASPDVVNQIRSRIGAFREQFNSERDSVGMRTVSYGSGTFGSILHGAISNSNILENSEGVSPVVVENMVEALQTIQAVLLTQRYNTVLARDCYSYTNNGTTINAVNFGPLFWHIARPELDLVLTYASQNNFTVGEAFSLDEESPGSERASEDPPEGSGERRNVSKVIFGNFNSRAGQWANKPISLFPINLDSVFSLFRERRRIGEFSCTFNQFLTRVFSQMRERENYTPDRSDTTSTPVPVRLEVPEIRYEVYKDPTDGNSWILYLYDNKVPLVRFHEAVEAIDSRTNSDGERVLPTKEEIKNILREQRVVYFEMGEEGSIIREANADTIADDTILSNNILLSNRTSAGIRNADAAAEIPAGISREFMAGNQIGATTSFRTPERFLPLQVSIDAYLMSTIIAFIPIFIFFPIRSFSGMYRAMTVTHQIDKSKVMTKVNLQADAQHFNTIPL